MDDETEKSNLNGRSTEDKDVDVIKFPSLAERYRLRRQKEKQEKEFRAQCKKNKGLAPSHNTQPFFNKGSVPKSVLLTISVFVAIHAITHILLSDAQILMLYRDFGFASSNYTGSTGLASFIGPITHMFIHASWMHVAVNCITFMIFGTFCIREFGTKITMAFFILCGLGGALLHFAINPFSQAPVIGASGAISGFFALFIVLAYKRGSFQNFKLVRKHGILPIIGFWMLFMFASAFLLGGGSHAWEAHMGGFLSGLLLLSWLTKKDLRFWRF